ncbi:hypothetical protein LTR85_004365 [Meristemomyces frigidus]|nr:hypothetical protein LTR85_004365 [Meristemomyces frigidus]
MDNDRPARSASKELCLLALDGGGVRGLSSLMILKSIMERINPEEPPKPCEYFDMIGGTSTGGLIAIMLGRLRMSIDHAIAAYVKLSPKIFKQQQHRVGWRGQLQGRFDDEALKQGVIDMLKDVGADEGALLKDSALSRANSSSACRTFVCATSKYTVNTVALSSYFSRRRGGDMLDQAKIWEAARATAAATTFFSPIEIAGESFVDGATGANNPIPTLWSEACDIWGADQDSNWRLEDNIRCFVSIGTGVPSLKGYRDQNLAAMFQTLVNISTASQTAAEDFRRQHSTMCNEGRFHRFDVDRGLGDIGLEEAAKVNDIRAATREYVQSETVHKGMEMVTRMTEWEECLESLEFQAMHRRRNLVELAEGRTNEWILTNPAYVAWREQRSSILWIQGKPGSGQSVLAKTILNAIAHERNASRENTACASQKPVVADWFYSIREGRIGMSHLSMLQSVLYEMLRQEPALFTGFRDVYRSTRRYPPDSWDWQITELRTMFEQAINRPEAPPVFVILDGLDESEETHDLDASRAEIMEMLQKFVVLEYSRLKIVVLSRPHQDIQAKFGQYSTIVMQEYNAGDIDVLIELRIRKMTLKLGLDVIDKPDSMESGWHSATPADRYHVAPEQVGVVPSHSTTSPAFEAVLDEIRQHLREKAEGVILWVHLVMIELIKLADEPFTPLELRDKLFELPTQLMKLYGRIVDDLLERNSERSLDKSRRLLQWVIGASIERPLTLIELWEALAIPNRADGAHRSDRDPIAERRLVIRGSWDDFRRKIYQLCGPFIATQKAGSKVASQTFQDHAHQSDIAQLVHQTAREFLARPKEAKGLCVNAEEATAAVCEGVDLYLDLILPDQAMPWAVTPLCPGPNYAAHAAKAADYLSTRHLFDFCRVFVCREGTVDHRIQRIQAAIVRPAYTTEDVRCSLTRDGLCYERFRTLCRIIHHDLRARRAAWLALGSSSCRYGQPSNSLQFLGQSAHYEVTTLSWTLATTCVVALQRNFPKSPLGREFSTATYHLFCARNQMEKAVGVDGPDVESGWIAISPPGNGRLSIEDAAHSLTKSSQFQEHYRDIASATVMPSEMKRLATMLKRTGAVLITIQQQEVLFVGPSRVRWSLGKAKDRTLRGELPQGSWLEKLEDYMRESHLAETTASSSSYGMLAKLEPHTLGHGPTRASDRPNSLANDTSSRTKSAAEESSDALS